MRLAALFSDHAVLQRGRTAPVWGWIGEVRVSSGPSNTEGSLAQVGARGEAEAAPSDLPRLRMFTVPRQAFAGRQSDAILGAA